MRRAHLSVGLGNALATGDSGALAPLMAAMADQPGSGWTAMCFAVTLIWSLICGVAPPPGCVERGKPTLRRNDDQDLSVIAAALLSGKNDPVPERILATCRDRLLGAGDQHQPDGWLAVSTVAGTLSGDAAICQIVADRLAPRSSEFLLVGPELPVGPAAYFRSEALAQLDQIDEARAANASAMRAVRARAGTGVWLHRVTTQQERLSALTLLTARQRAIMDALATGSTMAEAARSVYTSRATVEREVAKVRAVLGARSRTDAIGRISSRIL